MNELSVGYTKAVDLDRKIKVSAQLAQQSLYDMCRNIKEMRDSKLYKELGYSEFNDYCKAELDTTDRTAYKYISIAENLSEDLVKSTSLNSTEKLYLLSKLDEPEIEEIKQNTDLESTSVKELKAKIADLKKANDRLLEKVDEAEKKAENSRKSEEKACGKLSILQTDTEFYKKKIEQFEAKVKELESRPVEVAVADNSEEIEKLKGAAKEAENKYFAMIEKMSESDKEHANEVKRIKAEYEKRIAETSKAETVTVSDDKAIFKAYLSNAVDASKRLLEFINSHKNEPFFKDKTRELFNSILNQIEDKV